MALVVVTGVRALRVPNEGRCPPVLRVLVFARFQQPAIISPPKHPLIQHLLGGNSLCTPFLLPYWAVPLRVLAGVAEAEPGDSTDRRAQPRRLLRIPHRNGAHTTRDRI